METIQNDHQTNFVKKLITLYLYFYVMTWVCQTCNNFYVLFFLLPNMGQKVVDVITLSMHNTQSFIPINMQT